MKIRFLFLILASLILIVSCSKDKPTAGENEYNELVSRWEWVQSTGGIGGWTRTPESEGYIEELRFDSDSVVIMYRNKVIQWYKTYSIERKYSIITGDTVDMIVYDTGFLLEQQFEISDDGDTLFLSDNVADGFNHLYLNLIQPMD